MPASAAAVCQDLARIGKLRTAARLECEECVKIGSPWVHLRTCQSCGATLCCDSSPNRHARQHANTSGHPVISSAQPGERWLYCYLHDEMRDY